MYNRKHIKPDLLDTVIGKKIIKTLKPPADDYWEPTRNGLASAWDNYIRPNIWFIVGVVVIIVFLIYRYRSIKAEREAQKVADIYKSYYGPYVGPNGRRLPNFSSNSNMPENWSPSEYIPGRPKTSMDQYADMVLEIYNYQKENAREPKTTAWDPVHPLPQRQHQSRAQEWTQQPFYPYQQPAPSYSRSKSHASPRARKHNSHHHRSPRGMAYPMYPYEGGTLTPSGMY